MTNAPDLFDWTPPKQKTKVVPMTDKKKTTKPIKEAFLTPEQFKAWREGHGMTQTECGDALGLSLAFVQQAERGFVMRRGVRQDIPVNKTTWLAMRGYDCMTGKPVKKADIDRLKPKRKLDL